MQSPVSKVFLTWICNTGISQVKWLQLDKFILSFQFIILKWYWAKTLQTFPGVSSASVIQILWSVFDFVFVSSLEVKWELWQSELESINLCEHHQKLTMTIKQNWNILTLHQGQRFLLINQVHKLFSFVWKNLFQQLDSLETISVYPVKRYKLIWPLKHYLERKNAEDTSPQPHSPICACWEGCTVLQV